MADSIPATSGIYKITCTANKRIYVGSAINLQQRKRQHWRELRLNTHYNQHLQRAWNKYSEQAFIFEILEFTLEISRDAREQYWLDKLKPFGRKGFNIARDTTTPWRTPEVRKKIGDAMRGRMPPPETMEAARKAQTGRKHSPEEIEKWRQSRAGYTHSPEVREKLRQSSIGKKMSPEAVEKMRQNSMGNKYRLGHEVLPETREKIRQSLLGRKNTPEQIEKWKQSRERGKK